MKANISTIFGIEEVDILEQRDHKGIRVFSHFSYKDGIYPVAVSELKTGRLIHNGISANDEMEKTIQDIEEGSEQMKVIIGEIVKENGYLVNEGEVNG